MEIDKSKSITIKLEGRYKDLTVKLAEKIFAVGFDIWEREYKDRINSNKVKNDIPIAAEKINPDTIKNDIPIAAEKINPDIAKNDIPIAAKKIEIPRNIILAKTIPNDVKNSNDLDVSDVSDAEMPEYNSSIKGRNGENYVKKILDKYYYVEDVSKKSKSGDLMLTHGGQRIIIEVKKYKTAVPTDQIEKFTRDLDMNMVSGGMIISLDSKFSGKNGMISFDVLANAVYIASKDPEIIQIGVEILLALGRLRIRGSLYNSRELMSIADMIDHLTTDVERLSVVKYTLLDTKLYVNKQIESLSDELFKVILNIKSAISATSKSLDISVQNSDILEFNDRIKKYTIFFDADDLHNMIKPLNPKLLWTSDGFTVDVDNKSRLTVRLLKTKSEISVYNPATSPINDQNVSYSAGWHTFIINKSGKIGFNDIKRILN